jgi:hypothetical protein
MSFPQQNNKLKNYIIAPQFYVHENRLLRQPPSVLTSLVNQVYGALIDAGVPVSADSQFPSHSESWQPWHIIRKVNESIFMAAPINFRPETQQGVETGFVIVPEDSGGGMVHIMTDDRWCWSQRMR